MGIGSDGVRGIGSDGGGTYRVLVKVVDISGNDTTKMAEVQVPERGS